jgi:hypothetical protein
MQEPSNGAPIESAIAWEFLMDAIKKYKEDMDTHASEAMHYIGVSSYGDRVEMVLAALDALEALGCIQSDWDSMQIDIEVVIRQDQ